jgi:hypothetical protein
MNAAELCKPLLQEVNFGHRRIFTFMDWPLAPVSFKEKISSSDAGLLAMYFMETYNGKQFSLEFEDIKVSVSPFFNLLINGLLLLINGLFFIISLLFYFADLVTKLQENYFRTALQYAWKRLHKEVVPPPQGP